MNRGSIQRVCIWYSGAELGDEGIQQHLKNSVKSEIKGVVNNHRIYPGESRELVEECFDYDNKIASSLPSYIKMVIRGEDVKAKSGCLCRGPECSLVTLCVSFYYRRLIKNTFNSVTAHTTVDVCLTDRENNFSSFEHSFDEIGGVCDTSNTKRINNDHFQLNEWNLATLSFQAKCQDAQVNFLR